MAKYPLIVLLCFLGAMMLFQPELLCKLISFFVVKNSEPSDYRLSDIKKRAGLFSTFSMGNGGKSPTLQKKGKQQ